MKAVLEGRVVRLGQEGVALYEQSGYGRPEKGTVRLSPEESLYLLHRNRIEIPGWDFDRLLGLFAKDPMLFRRFLVYRDLRERGYAVQTGPHDFRVFRRGERPGTGESRYTVRVLSEQDLADFGRLIAEAGTSVRMRKTYLLAVVDDENELTYYEVKVQALPSVGEAPECAPLRATLAGRTAFIAPGEAGPDTCEPYGMQLDPDRLVLSPFEIIQMGHAGTITLVRDGEKVGVEEYAQAASQGDPEFHVKARVFEDLRNRG
ncbi:MAG: tRNA-intron lyase, partial [Methanoregulaceae archaeon]|nr:tRNA-intron lyase [Methanoregulaceae archaeon]